MSRSMSCSIFATFIKLKVDCSVAPRTDRNTEVDKPVCLRVYFMGDKKNEKSGVFLRSL